MILSEYMYLVTSQLTIHVCVVPPQVMRVTSVRDVARCLPTNTTETNISNTPGVWTRETGSSRATCVLGK